jgi:oxygen-independent coproporphyrinogen III oxidase
MAFSLYFHIPFCKKKCDYCHFYVIPDKDPFKKQLLAGFNAELSLWQPVLAEKKLASIYFGGGTPSLIGAEAIWKILNWVDRITPIPHGIEITLEANPENITLALMKSYRDAGINRVSIGIQSLDDPLLAFLGRTHSAQQSIEAVNCTAEAGLKNITIDLMYDLPGQNLAAWKNTLKQALDLPITHLSLYNLTIEPHTVFFKRRNKIQGLMPDEDVSLQMYLEAISALEAKNFHQYEISAFAKAGFYSCHNTGYWTARDFLGFGPSAFSYYCGKRFRNIANLNKYCKKLEEGSSPIDFEEHLPPLAAQRELLAIQLRLMQGIDLKQFEERHGPLDLATKTVFAGLKAKGLIEGTEDHIKLSKEGILFYDTVAEEIILLP